MRTSILVMSAGALPAVSVIKALRDQKQLPLRMVTCDMDRFASGAFLGHAFRQVPSAHSPQFIPAVLRLCKKERIRWIFPVMDEELLKFAQKREYFRQLGIGVIVNNAHTIKLAGDKWKAYQFCLEKGILAPSTFRVSDAKQNGIGSFPVIIKPRHGRGSVGVVQVQDKKEWALLRKRRSKDLVQQYVKGREYTVDLIVSPKGNVLQAIPRERWVTKAGTSYKGITRSLPHVVRFAKRVALLFGVDGPTNVQCIERRNKLYFLELNPKFGTGLSLTVAAGVNLPLMQLKLAMGKQVNSTQLKFIKNKVMMRYWEEVFSIQRGSRG